MTAIQTRSPEKIFGIFELDDSGIVRYSKPKTGYASTETAATLIGEDFFELAAFDNRDDLRRRFKRFIESHDAANSFTFDCHYDESIVRARVMMTRAFRTDYFPPEGIVMLDIRENN